MVQRDQYVFFVTVEASTFIHRGGSEPTAPTMPTVALATAFAETGEPSPDDPTIEADGTSTGGLWGLMPATDDPLLMGLVPLREFNLYPTPNQ